MATMATQRWWPRDGYNICCVYIYTQHSHVVILYVGLFGGGQDVTSVDMSIKHIFGTMHLEHSMHPAKWTNDILANVVK